MDVVRRLASTCSASFPSVKIIPLNFQLAFSARKISVSYFCFITVASLR